MELESVLAAAAACRPEVRRGDRAGWLEAVAAALDAASAELVELAGAETHLPAARLTGELTRTTFQARLFADGLRSGELLPVRIDAADPDWGMGPRPDLRRTVVPIGPVLVFAAGNFPFAFSVFGGDTVSALAAGCPVVVKAHPGHPEVSRRTAAIVAGALRADGADPRAWEIEMFGPAGLVVGYASPDRLLAMLRQLPGQLTGTVQGHSTGTDPVAEAAVDALTEVAGRIIYNGWPTGVTVSGAQQHGGPYPATTAPTTTSVGLSAIARFQRPVAYQGAPAAMLPAELRDVTL